MGQRVVLQVPGLIRGRHAIDLVASERTPVDDLDKIVQTSLEWERKIVDRDPKAYWAA